MVVTVENHESNDVNNHNRHWVRGVNIGGWLLAERFITPYLFAINSCHIEGSLCWYPGQSGAPNSVAELTSSSPAEESTSSASKSLLASLDNMNLRENAKSQKNSLICDPDICEPVKPILTKDGNHDYHPRNAKWYHDYPQDEYTLGQIFQDKEIGRKYIERHWDTFLTFDDLRRLKQAGVTTVRVPMGYWIRGDVQPGEPYIPGGWPYFVRMVGWCREVGLEVWPDLHGAPGSENGFDNSGQYLQEITCLGWSSNPENVARTLRILEDIITGIIEEGLTDVITGFGLLNEPFLDCDKTVLRNYYNDAHHIVRTMLGKDVTVFVGDTFNAHRFNDGFWTDPVKYNNTLLDTHPYHIFFEQGRAMTPKQHIAYVCRYNNNEVNSCCHEDYDNLGDGVTGANSAGKASSTKYNQIPSRGIGRLVGEWSAAYDILPTALTQVMMKMIAKNGVAPLLDRQLSKDRQQFMRNFVEAQMVTYESASTGVSSGWLFWNFKMEGGAFAEWDFLRGIEEGWIPHIPSPSVSSESLYGSCFDIINKTSDDYNAVVDEFPDPRSLDWNQYQGWSIEDEYVLQIGAGVRNFHQNTMLYRHFNLVVPALFMFLSIFVCFLPKICRKFKDCKACKACKKYDYVELK